MATIPNTSPTMYTIPGTNPSTVIELYKGVSIPDDYEYICYWHDKQQQDNYFNSHLTKKVTISNMLYVNHTQKTVRIGLPIRELVGCNYLTMINSDNNFENKKFYYFITGVKSINNNTTELTIDIDVMNTFWWDFELNECFVVRQHTTTDYYFDNLVPENIGTGEYISNRFWGGKYGVSDNSQELSFAKMAFFLILASRIVQSSPANPTQILPWPNIHFYGTNFFSSSKFYAFPIWSSGAARQRLNDLIDEYQGHFNDCFGGTYLIPEWVANELLVNDPADPDFYLLPNGLNHPLLASRELIFNPFEGTNWSQTTEIYNGSHYTPRNLKLYNAPYRFLRVLSTTGDNHVYGYELFKNITINDMRAISFEQYCNPVAAEGSGVNVTTVPKNYRGRPENWDESVTWDMYAPAAMTDDQVKRFCDFNKLSLLLAPVQFGLSAGTSIAGFGAGVSNMHDISKGYTDAFRSAGFSQAGAKDMSRQIIAENYQSELASIGNDGVKAYSGVLNVVDNVANISHTIQSQIPQNRNISSNTSLSAEYNGVFFSDTWLRAADLKRLDAFFDRFGYALNEFRKPVLNARPVFTYIQTSGCTLTPLTNGFINCGYEDIIRGVFNRGVTVWNTGSGQEIGQFSENVFNANKALFRGFKP